MARKVLFIKLWIVQFLQTISFSKSESYNDRNKIETNTRIRDDATPRLLAFIRSLKRPAFLILTIVFVCVCNKIVNTVKRKPKLMEE
jgi:hypothetical protein